MGKVILNGVEYQGGGVSDVEVNGSSVVNAQGVAEITEVDDVGLTSTLELGTSTADGALDGQLELWGGTPLFRGKATLKAHHAQTGDLTFELPATSGMLARKSDIPTKTSDLTNDSDFVSDNPTFTEASTRANIASGESFATILGKIKKFFTDLKSVAFSGAYSDLSGTPTKLSDFTDDVGYLESSDIIVTQVQSTGTKIATIDVDGTSTDLYAPAGGGGGSVNDVTVNGTSVVNAQGVAEVITSDRVAKAGDTMSGDLTFQGSSDDSPDVIFRYGNGNEKTRLWTDDTYTSRKGINYRIYKNDGTLIYSGQLATVADIPDISTKVSKSGDTMTGKLTIDASYTPLAINRTNDAGMCYLGFGNSNGTRGYFAVGNDKLPYFEPQGGSDQRIALLDEIQLGNEMGNTAYESNDTHYMKLCTITLGQYYEYVSLLITSSFWGNQHGSADIINIQASKGSSSTETGVTVQRFHLAGSGGNGSYREFYYTNSNNTLTLYVYVTGGNSYGSWNISELRLKNVGITYNFTTNVSLPSDASGVYSSTTFDSLTAYEFQLTHPGLDFYDPIFDKHMYLIRPGTLTADRSIYLPNKNGTIALLSDISSRRYKENIVPLSDDEAKKLLDIDIVNYDYKEGVVEEDERYDQKGAIAEDVVNLIPNAVTYADIDGEQLPDGINYTKFIPYLIKMVQIQQKEIEELKAMIKGE